MQPVVGAARLHQEAEPAGAPVSWWTVAGGREYIFPVSSLGSSIQWKESPGKPLLPAREQCRALTCGQRLLQVSESSPGPVCVWEGPYFSSSCWQVLGLLQTCFLGDSASCLHIISSLCCCVFSQHLRLRSFLFLQDSQVPLGRSASGQALWGHREEGRGT